jgi:hypothetical protein
MTSPSHDATPDASLTGNKSSLRWFSKLGGLIFVIGIITYLVLQTSLVVAPMLRRTVPVETDDAYTYILKAAEMRACFSQDCPALNYLRPQLLKPADAPKTAWIQYREYFRAFVVYHPLHSLILLGLNAVGLSWEAAYNVIVIAGAIFLGLAIAYWLYSLWGASVAGIAMAFLAVSLFPGQGLHYIVPSNLSLGIAILIWGIITLRKWNAHWFVLAGVIAMVTMHTTGRLYALVTLLLYYLFADPNLTLPGLRNWTRRLSRQQWIAIGIAFLVVLLAFILPVLINRPDLSVKSDPPPANWKFWYGYRDNILEALKIVQGWITSYLVWIVPGVLLSVGILATPRARRRPVLITIAIIGALLLASLLFVLPRYPAEAFSRIWIPFSILMTGVMAQVIVTWFIAIAKWIKNWRRQGIPELTNSRWMLSAPGWGAILLILIGMLICAISINRIQKGQYLLRETARIMTWKQNVKLDPVQPEQLLSKGCAPVLYMSEVPMHFYFSRGAMDCEAVYYPALEKDSALDAYIEEVPYLVDWNPSIESGLLSGGNSLTLAAGDNLKIQSVEELDLNSIEMYLENPGERQALTIIPSLAGGLDIEPIKLEIPAGSSGWYRLTNLNMAARGLTIQASDKGQPILVQGLRTSPTRGLYWPWDEGISLNYQPKNPQSIERTIQFETGALYPFLNRSLRILSDNGATVLFELEAAPAALLQK